MHPKIKSLLSGMLYFLLAVILTLALFWGIWAFFVDPELASREQLVQPADTASVEVADSEQIPVEAKLPEDTQAEKKQEVKPETETQTQTEEPEVKLQGPQAGTNVLPPSRNVTPGFEASPLAQTQPLKREVGSPLPPPPKRAKLPPFFRKVAVVSSTELKADLRSSQVILKLADIDAPPKDQSCVMFGQKANCNKLAKTALQRFLRGRGISCDISDEQQKAYQSGQQSTDPLSGRCMIGRMTKTAQARNMVLPDLGEWMVRYGWALPHDGHYQAALEEAKAQKRGLHSELSGTTKHGQRRLSNQTQSALDQLANDAIQSSGSEPANFELIAPESDTTSDGNADTSSDIAN